LWGSFYEFGAFIKTSSALSKISKPKPFDNQRNHPLITN
jgi:hypothetical protein